MSKTLIVIGGGAAGFFCAVNAAQLHPGLRVCILEKTGKLLSKVRISGGGRCNVTHACFDIAEMSKKYPRGNHFLKKAFHLFFTDDTIQWFKERGVALKTEEDGRVFPVTNSSQTIIDCLLNESMKYAIEIRLHTEVKRIVFEKESLQVQIASGESLSADAICIACGGYPKSNQFEWITALGHSIEPPVPSLFTFNLPGNAITALMGVAVTAARVKIAGTTFSETGPLLITHWGLSGPAILKLSAIAARTLPASNYRFAITVNWLPEYTEQRLKNVFHELRQEDGSRKISQKNSFGLPHRLWEYLLNLSGIADAQRWADLKSETQRKLIANLVSQQLQVEGKTTFKEEFVTAGGTILKEIDPNTMQSKIVPRLYFAGEVMDVDGVTGGYNFQYAWTSGYIAAKAIAQNI